jgi:hypothetical protein
VLLQHLCTDADLSLVLLHYIFAWLTGNLPNPVTVLLPNPSLELFQAVVAQNAIRWGQIFRGRMSIQWAYLFHHAAHQTNNESLD